MKHLLALCLMCFLATACSTEIQENNETRSTVYRGQTTWDLYENFGAPSYAVRVSPNEFHFVYQHEAITRDWTRLFFDWCDYTFVVVDDHVTDWAFEGNQCTLNVGDPVEVSDNTNARKSRTERYSSRQDNNGLAPSGAIYSRERDGYSDTLF